MSSLEDGTDEADCQSGPRVRPIDAGQLMLAVRWVFAAIGLGLGIGGVERWKRLA